MNKTFIYITLSAVIWIFIFIFIFLKLKSKKRKINKIQKNKEYWLPISQLNLQKILNYPNFNTTNNLRMVFIVLL